MKNYLIYKYLLRETLYPFFMIILILTFVLLMGRILQLMDLMINKGVGLSVVSQLILYLVPSFLTITIPIAILISILISMGRLSRENEILVMKSAGISLYQLVPPIAVLAAAAFAASLLLGIYVVPAGNIAGRELLIEMAREKAGIGVKEKIFNDDFPGLMLYADQVSMDGVNMKGVFISDHRTARNPVTVIARSGRMITDAASGDVILRLEEGSTHMVGGDLNTYRTMNFRVYDISLDMSGNLSGSGADYGKEGEESMTIGRILRDLREGKVSGAERNVLLMELNKRLAVPLTCIVFALIALPLGMVKHRTAKSRGFVIGLFIVAVYYVLQLGGDALGETGKIHPVTAAWAPNVILGAAGLWLFFKSAAEKPYVAFEAIKNKIRVRMNKPA
ncbi:MAG: LPS export ABC transporter permease LptF [Syntrophales bacterium]|nr:LPS export ABC transporter permease LptF [Syntrophales bacterium]